MVYIDTHIDSVDVEVALAGVSAQRREHILRYKREENQRQSLAAYVLLQRALREEYGIEEPPVFVFDEHGKPFLEGYPDIFFSLSHCREAAACVVGRTAVGIDVESLDHYNKAVVERVMNDDECREIALSADPQTAFMRLWTMKESFLKMTGAGITTDLRNVLSQRAVECRFETSVHDGFVCTVCYGEDGG